MGHASLTFAVSWGDGRASSPGRKGIEKGKSANTWLVLTSSEIPSLVTCPGSGERLLWFRLTATILSAEDWEFQLEPQPF